MRLLTTTPWESVATLLRVAEHVFAELFSNGFGVDDYRVTSRNELRVVFNIPCGDTTTAHQALFTSEVRRHFGNGRHTYSCSGGRRRAEEGGAEGDDDEVAELAEAPEEAGAVDFLGAELQQQEGNLVLTIAPHTVAGRDFQGGLSANDKAIIIGVCASVGSVSILFAISLMMKKPEKTPSF